MQSGVATGTTIQPRLGALPTHPAARATGWLPGLVLAVFTASAFLVPTLSNVSSTDDWAYYRTVETLVTEHRVHIHEMSSAALVFQAFWGAAFAAVLGLSFAALRISTLVVVVLGGLALYGLCRDLGVSRTWSALGMAAYLFHPLALPLSYTFMTDPHFTSLLLVSTWLYARGLGGPTERSGYVLAGSAVAACAILVRQQGVLIPLAVAAALAVERRLPMSRAGLAQLAAIGAVPAATTVVYMAWLRFVHGIPWALNLFSDDLRNAGWQGVAALMPQLAAIEVAYLGFFALPLAVALVPGFLRPPLRMSRGRMLALLAWAGIAVLGPVLFALQGRWMPYAGQFVTVTGLGPEDLIAARPLLVDLPVREAWTAACAVAAVVFGLALARGSSHFAICPGPGHRLVLAIAAGQVLGTVPASVHFVVWDGTLDRYLLPLLPLAVVLLLSATRWQAGLPAVATVAIVAMGVLSVAGTWDYLVYTDTTWSLAREANQLGVPNTRLDAGAGWDGFHLFQQPPSPTRPPLTARPPWWVDLFAPSTDSSYVVAGARLPGYTVVRESRYWSWLRRDWLTLYLERRPGVLGPP